MPSRGDGVPRFSPLGYVVRAKGGCTAPWLAARARPYAGGMSTNQRASAFPERSQIGLWVTADRAVRHELRADGSYVEARGRREAAYTGRYWMEGPHIEYLDDTGFRADGDFVEGILYHGGMVLTKVETHGGDV